MAGVRAGENIAFMMNFVCDFIDERMDRLSFDLDFDHYLNEKYDGMYKEDPEVAEVFADCIGDIVNMSEKMSDDEFRDALCDPYDLVMDILKGMAY